ncbi:hypothetical protein BX600DRAFT_452050 [Xylariales sp. PMI_506]|nr:hypothetical protein BX600DRAFT_452050 [Xylariales sp. PMI_506]
MVQNILVTAAGGYIGGSIVTDFLSRAGGPIKAARIYATVRSQDQLEILTKLGINAILVDLNDEKAVLEVVIEKEINIVIQVASSMNPPLVLNLIRALGERRKTSGQETYFVHSSVATLFAPEVGWRYGQAKDTDPLFEREKEQAAELGYHPVREVTIAVMKQAKESGVTAFNVVVPNVYGTGSGPVRKLSVSFPAWIRSGLKDRIIHKFDTDNVPPQVHVSDLVEVYALITENILSQKPIPSGEEGYYFTASHRTSWWRVMDGFAKYMHQRGLIEEPTAQVWPSLEVAAQSLGFPVQYVRVMGPNDADIVPVHAYQLGWQPKWDEKRFLESLEQEVEAVLQWDVVKPTIFNSLLSSS